MPDATGETQTDERAVPVPDGFFDALEALVEAGPAYGGPDETPDAPVASETPPAADPSTPTAGEPAEPASAPEPAAGRPVVAEAAPAPSPSTDPVESTPAESTETEAGVDGQPTGESRRAAWRERDAALARAQAAEQRLAELQGSNPAPPATPDPQPAAPSRPAVAEPDDARVQAEVLDFIGMAPPTDEDGKPISGEEPLYVRLDREAKSSGIQYEDEQARYKELTERSAMAGKIYGLARRVAWQQVASDLVEPELGLDDAAVSAAGNVSSWKRAFRSALETRVASDYRGRNQAEIDSARAETERVKAEYEQKLAEATRRLEEREANHTGQLAAARGVRSVVSGGRPSNRNGSAATFGSGVVTSTDLVDQLADAFRETAEGR